VLAGLLSLLVPTSAFAAFNATAVCEVEQGGSDTTCAGGYDAGISGAGTDYSKQTTAQATGTATSSGTTLTATTGIFTSAMVGNAVTNGTTTTFITVYTNATTVTVQTAPTWTSQTIYVGGALASIGKACAIFTVSSNVIYQKSGSTYSITSSSSNVAAGIASISQGVSLIGYSTNRTISNTDTPPINQASGIASVAMITLPGGISTATMVQNVTCDGNNLTGMRGFSIGGNYITINRCNAINCKNNGFSVPNSIGVRVSLCYASGCTTTAAFLSNGGTEFFGCVAQNNTGTIGFDTCNCVNCISYHNSIGYSWSNNNNGLMFIIGSTAHSNTTYGFDLSTSGAATRGSTLINCIAYNNTTKDIYSNNATYLPSAFQLNCAYATTDVAPQNSVGQVTLTGDPCTNASGGNFSLNNTAGAGAACRAAGFPGSFNANISTTGYQDIGAVQHQATGGGGLPPLNSQMQGGFSN